MSNKFGFYPGYFLILYFKILAPVEILWKMLNFVGFVLTDNQPC